MSSETAQSESAPVTETPVTSEVAPVEAVEPVSPPQPDLSAQFADLKRQERELRAERNKLKLSMESAKTQWVEELKKDPIGKLKEFGLTADRIAESLLGEAPSAAPQESPVTHQLKQELDELKADKQARAIAEYRKEVFDVVEKLPEEYELLLNSKGGRDLYWNSVVEYYQTYGEAPDYKALASSVEDALLEEGKKMLSFKKLQPPPVAPPKAKDEKSDFTTLDTKLVGDSYGSRIKPQVTPVTSSTTRSAQSDYHRYMEDSKQAIISKFLNS